MEPAWFSADVWQRLRTKLGEGDLRIEMAKCALRLDFCPVLSSAVRFGQDRHPGKGDPELNVIFDVASGKTI